LGIEVLPHTERYARTAAYIEIIKGLWTAEPGTFNHESKWYRIRGGWVMPQPTQKPHPSIANAGLSEEARELLARAFISPPSTDASAGLAADFQMRAARHGRSVKCCCFPLVVWRETEREAIEERRRILEQMDREAAENWARGLLPQSGSFDNFTLEMFTLGAGGLPIFGTRDQVAESLDRLYRSGIDGVLMVFLSYYQDTLRFEREIMPLLRQLGTIRSRNCRRIVTASVFELWGPRILKGPGPALNAHRRSAWSGCQRALRSGPTCVESVRSPRGKRQS